MDFPLAPHCMNYSFVLVVQKRKEDEEESPIEITANLPWITLQDLVFGEL